MTTKLLQKQISPNGEEFVRCIKRQGTPSRVHTIELSIDGEIEEAVCKRYDVLKGLDPSDEYYAFKRKIAIQRFLGYDYVIVDIENNRFPLTKMIVEDSSGNLKREGGRSYIDEHKGPVMSMDDFKQYPWPNPSTYMTKALEWYNKNLPDDMVIIGGLTGHFFEHLSWLMGYETLCLALCEEPELIRAISDRELELDRAAISLMLQFDRVKVIWGSDDMGFKGGLMISPDQMREYVLAGHKNLAAMTHAAGRSYILHSCGKLNDIYEDLITDVGIDGKHSYEDTI
jgi:uroporphyrinogen decarboxylase